MTSQDSIPAVEVATGVIMSAAWADREVWATATRAERRLIAEHVTGWLGSVPSDVLGWYAEQHPGSVDDAALQLGHDLYLSAAGHGSGFWDRRLGAVGDYLHQRAKELSWLEHGAVPEVA